MIGSILDGKRGRDSDDHKDSLKEDIGALRSQTFSAPPTMTLYDYDVKTLTLRNSPRSFSMRMTETRTDLRRNW
jgi:hypothetical protein